MFQDSNFIYHHSVSAKNYISRKKEEEQILAAWRAQENICLYKYSRYGYTSLLANCIELYTKEADFISIEFSILDCRSSAKIKERLNRYLNKFCPCENMALEAAYEVAEALGKDILISIKEFNNILWLEDMDDFVKEFEALKKYKEKQGPKAIFIVSGSQTNAMKEIFDVQRYFYRQFNRIKLEDLAPDKICDYIIKGFAVGGKVVNKELLLPICKKLRYNMWYINQFCKITDDMTKGYIPDAILKEAFQRLVFTHQNYFVAAVNSLTTFQLQFLIALCAGHQKFTSSQVISKYQLNSSANVKRLRDALIKKEIISFDDDNLAYFLDPLFEHWFKEYFLNLAEI